MRIKSPLLACALAVYAGYSSADQVVAFIDGATTANQSKPYLASGVFRDQGYVYVSASVEDPQDKPCIAPATNSFFSAKQLDVTLTAQIFGFFGIDPTKEVPLATFSWSGKDSAYCRSAWSAPIVLVPPTPIGVSRGINIPLTPADNPTIVVRLRSSSSDKEKISTYAQGLLGIAAGLATGGAAVTVVGLTHLAEGPAAKYLSDELNKHTQNTADQTKQVVISWNDIVNGTNSKHIHLMQSELRTFNDPVDQAISDLSNGKRKNAKPVLTVKFNILLRRTMFDDDANLVAPKYLPRSSAELLKYAVLNFPRRTGGFLQGFPTVFQKINSEAPSFVQKLAAKDVTSCDQLLVAVHDLGFDEIDRAIVIGAILDDSYTGWRKDPNFYNACLQSELAIKNRLTDIYNDEPYFPAVVAPPILTPPELSTNLPGFWTPAIQEYMSKFRLAMFSSGNARTSALKELLGTPSKFAVAPTLASSSNPSAPDNTVSDIDQLVGATSKRVGCIFGYVAEAKGYAALVFSAQNKTGGISPYLLIADLTSPTGKPAILQSLWVYDLTSAPGTDFLDALGQAKFGANSICSGADAEKKPRSVSQILADLVK